MKRRLFNALMSALFSIPVAPGLFWLGGGSFTQRGPELAGMTAISLLLAGGVFVMGTILPYDDE